MDGTTASVGVGEKGGQAWPNGDHHRLLRTTAAVSDSDRITWITDTHVLTLPGGGRAEEAPPRSPNDVRCGRRNYRCGSLPAAFSPTCLNHVAPARITLVGGGQVSVAGAVAACCPASSTHRTSGNCTDLWQRWGVAHDDLA